jgi:hypothetical protein
MANVRGTFPTLINGVSQQDPAIRLSSQCEAQSNAYASIAEGLVTRPPTEYIAALAVSTAANHQYHIIDRDPGEQFLVGWAQGVIQVFDLSDGSQAHVTDNGGTYLNTTNSPREDGQLLTIADHTFIVNRNVTVAMAEGSGSLSPTNDPLYTSVIWWKAFASDIDFEVMEDNVRLDGFNSETGKDIYTHARATAIEINEHSPITATVFGNYSNYVYITHTESYNIEIIDEKAGDASVYVVVVDDEVDSISDLPPKSFNGHITHILSDPESEVDDYYVKFVANDLEVTSGKDMVRTGQWEECVAPGIVYQFDLSTMPHVLVRTADVSGAPGFTVQQGSWTGRVAGDVTSVPNPSFVGQEIQDVFLFQDRLGFVSQSNVIMSTVGDYWSFWPDTIVTLLDDAPIDVSVGTRSVPTIKYALPYKDRLMLFADQTQFTIPVDETTLTQKSIRVLNAAWYPMAENVEPVLSGDRLMFATPRGDYLGVQELRLSSTNDVLDSSDITAHAPQYIEGSEGRYLVPAANERALFVLTSTNQNDVELYQYYWSGESKVQSAWSRWDYGTDMQMKFMHALGDTMYCVAHYDTDNTLYLLKQDITAAQDDTSQDWRCSLDRRVTETQCVSVTYSDPNTTITLPYKIESTPAVMIRSTDNGQVVGKLLTIVGDPVGGTTIVVSGDHTTSDFWAGELYTFSYTFSPPQVRDREDQVVIRDRVQVMDFTLRYADTIGFTVSVTPRSGATPYTYSVGPTMSELESVTATPSALAGVLTFPVRARADEVTITVTSGLPFPVHLISAEWNGRYTTRNKR